MTPTTPNFDVQTQTHYGVISYHSVNSDALQDVFDNGENLTYAAASKEAKGKLRGVLQEWFGDYKHGKQESQLDRAVNAAWDAIEDDWNDQYSGDDEQFFLARDGYKISNSPSLVCLFIEASPYYTYTRPCSPCAPNAGDLDTPSGELKTYCLGPEWFDDDKAPYPVYRVADDSRA